MGHPFCCSDLAGGLGLEVAEVRPWSQRLNSGPS